MLKRVRTIVVLIVAFALTSTLVGLVTEQEAIAGTESRVGFFVTVYQAMESATEGAIKPGNNTGCATDWIGVTDYQKRRVCKLKSIGAWEGSNFWPQSTLTRQAEARALWKATIHLKYYFPGSTRADNRATDPNGAMGWCSNYFVDCGQFQNQEGRNGAAFMKYHGLRTGWSDNTYRPKNGAQDPSLKAAQWGQYVD